MFLSLKLLNISVFVDVIGMMVACMWLYRLCCVRLVCACPVTQDRLLYIFFFSFSNEANEVHTTS